MICFSSFISFSFALMLHSGLKVLPLSGFFSSALFVSFGFLLGLELPPPVGFLRRCVFFS